MLLAKYEGQPYAILEYLAHGLPVICNRFSGASEYINKDVGYLLPRYSTSELNNVLEEVCAMEERKYNRIKSEVRICCQILFRDN